MDKDLLELENCLRQMTQEHRELFSLLQRKQQAMRVARPDVVHDCCRQENIHVQRIGQIETQRQHVLGRLTAKVAPKSKEPLTITQIADHAGEPRRGRLLVLRQQLREMIWACKRENEIARDATQSLLNHVQGVIQQVASAMGVGTYGRRGTVPQTSSLASTFTVTG